jgi:hypothetical protein
MSFLAAEHCAGILDEFVLGRVGAFKIEDARGQDEEKG